MIDSDSIDQRLRSMETQLATLIAIVEIDNINKNKWREETTVLLEKLNDLIHGKDGINIKIDRFEEDRKKMNETNALAKTAFFGVIGKILFDIVTKVYK